MCIFKFEYQTLHTAMKLEEMDLKPASESAVSLFSLFHFTDLP